MINKLNSVEQVEVIRSGEKMVASLESSTPPYFESSFPLSFSYNENWKVTHKCTCGASVGNLKFDFSTKERFPKYSYYRTEYCNSKHFTNDFLQSISNIFQKTEILSFDSIEAIIYNKKFTPDFPLTSAIELGVYTCDSCRTEYIAIIKNQSPRQPDQGLPNGLTGQIEIKEIISVKSSDNIQMETLIENEKRS